MAVLIAQALPIATKKQGSKFYNISIALHSMAKK
jgi:hypothetical protein